MLSRPTGSRDLEAFLTKVQASLLPPIAHPGLICQSVVLPVLHRLGWDIEDVGVVTPDYGDGAGGIAFCLNTPAQPTLLVYVSGETRLFRDEYDCLEKAGSVFARIAVLTNGMQWWMYLAETTVYPGFERFAILDLPHRETESAAADLFRFLGRARVASGEAISSAKDLFVDPAHQELLKGAMARAWLELCSDPDDSILSALAERTGSLSGYLPSQADLMAFVRAALARGIEAREFQAAPTAVVPESPNHPLPPRPGRTQILGRSAEPATWTDLLLEVCRQVALRQNADFERLLSDDDLSRLFSRDLLRLSAPQLVAGTDIYVETGMPDSAVPDCCRRILALFNYAEGSLRLAGENYV